jgi:hypothetical protein
MKTRLYTLLLLSRWGEIMPLWNWSSNRPFVHAPDNIQWIWNSGGITITGENRRKNCPSATLSTKNPIWTVLGASPGRRLTAWATALSKMKLTVLDQTSSPTKNQKRTRNTSRGPSCCLGLKATILTAAFRGFTHSFHVNVETDIKCGRIASFHVFSNSFSWLTVHKLGS